jgi:hypothetical protein
VTRSDEDDGDLLAYGYLSLPPRVSHEQVSMWRAQLGEVARARGLMLAGVFIDDRRNAPDGCGALVEAARRRQVRHVIVPGVEHFTHSPGLHGAERRSLARHLGVDVVWVASEQLQASRSRD